MTEVKFVVVLQCHIVKERCSGFFCENSFWKREGGFADYDPHATMRYINMTCGGCCGKATHRKLGNFLKQLENNTDIKPEETVLHFSSCICQESFHGPKCPHYDYLKQLVERHNIPWREGTALSELAQKRRDADGHWHKD